MLKRAHMARGPRLLSRVVLVVLAFSHGVGTDAFRVGGGPAHASTQATVARIACAAARPCEPLHTAPAAFCGGASVCAVVGTPLSTRTRVRETRHGVRGMQALGGGAALKSTLRRYGLAAAVTHASGWVGWLLLGYTALEYVDADRLAQILPANLVGEALDSASSQGRAALSPLARAEVAVALNEFIGPLRLAVTLAVTPKVADFSRSFQVTRDIEAYVVRGARSRARATAASLKKLDYKAVLAELAQRAPLQGFLFRGDGQWAQGYSGGTVADDTAVGAEKSRRIGSAGAEGKRKIESEGQARERVGTGGSGRIGSIGARREGGRRSSRAGEAWSGGEPVTPAVAPPPVATSALLPGIFGGQTGIFRRKGTRRLGSIVRDLDGTARPDLQGKAPPPPPRTEAGLPSLPSRMGVDIQDAWREMKRKMLVGNGKDE